MSDTTALIPVFTAQPPRLLDQLRQTALARYGRAEPATRHAQWVLRFILFHGKRHPRELGLAEVGQFLQHLAQCEKDPLRSLEQAREALEFLYQSCLHLRLGELPFPEPPRLLDRLRRALRLRHYSPRTENCYVDWVTRYIRFHGLRHPNTMGGAEIELFLTDLAVRSRRELEASGAKFMNEEELKAHIKWLREPDRIDETLRQLPGLPPSYWRREAKWPKSSFPEPQTRGTMAHMERSSIAVESVKNLQASGRRLLEDILGQKLQENQQVFIMVLSPGTEPDEAARQKARAGLEATFQKTEAYAREHDISDDQIDPAIAEAMEHVRPRKD